MTAPTTSPERARLLSRGLRLEYLTVGWNVAEGFNAVASVSRASPRSSS